MTEQISFPSQNGQAGAELTQEQLNQFYRLFQDWVDEYPNREALEEAGLGDWETLARRVHSWALRLA